MYDIEKLKKARKEKKITYKELAEKTGIRESTIYAIFSGQTNSPRIDTLQALESVLLSDSDDYNIFIDNAVELNDNYAIAILGRVVAGVPIESQEYLEGYIYINFKPKENYFALRVSGSSMINAGIPDRSILVVKKQNTANNNNIIVALLNGEQTVKRFKKYDETVFLMPENPAFEPIPITDKDDLLILGKVVEIRITV